MTAVGPIDSTRVHDKLPLIYASHCHKGMLLLTSLTVYGSNKSHMYSSFRILFIAAADNIIKAVIVTEVVKKGKGFCQGPSGP